MSSPTSSRRRPHAQRAASLLSSAVLSLLLASCEGDDFTLLQATETLIVAPSAVTCARGGQVPVAASLQPARARATFAFAVASGGVTITPGPGTGEAVINCVGAGPAVVTVTSSTGQVFTVPVTVSEPPPPRIIVSPTSVTIAVTGTARLDATVLTTGAVSQAVTFTSLDTTVAVVSATGVVTGRRPGLTTVLVQSADQPTSTAAVSVAVVTGTLPIGLTPSPTSLDLQVGATQRLTVGVLVPPNWPATTSRAVLFRSADTTIATVDTTGLVTGRRAGGTSILVRAVADTSFFVFVPVRVGDVGVRLSIQRLTDRAGVAIDPNVPVGTAAAGVDRTGTVVAHVRFAPGSERVGEVQLRLLPLDAMGRSDTTRAVTVCRHRPDSATTTASAAAQFENITCSIDLAAREAATGAALFRDGTYVLMARVVGVAADGRLGPVVEHIPLTNLQIRHAGGALALGGVLGNGGRARAMPTVWNWAGRVAGSVAR